MLRILRGMERTQPLLRQSHPGISIMYRVKE
jgi:hypothetical protein